MATQLDYNQKSINERIILKEVIKLLYDTTTHDIQYYFTDVEGKDIYDGYVMIFTKGTGSIIKRHLIEVKVRDIHYEDLLLEKKKLTNLKNKADESQASVIYISCTPEGSFVYNLSRLETEIGFEWVKEEHNKTTTDKSLGKVMKTITYLPTKYAKYINVRQTDLEVLKRLKRAEETIIKTTVQSKQRRCIYDILLFGEKITNAA